MLSLRTLPRDLRLFAKYYLKLRVVDYPAPETELGVVSLGFELDSYLASLRQCNDRFDVDVLCTVTYRDRPYPIVRIRSRMAHPRKTLMVLGGVHGNEHAGLLAVPKILDGYNARNVRLVVITPVNPVGAAELSRYNANGYDINRDFARFNTPEARAVRRAFNEDRPDFMVTLHEGPQAATFMFTNRRVDPALAERLVEAIAQGGTVLADKDYFGRTLQSPGLAPTTRALYWLSMLWAHILQMKTTALWAEEYGVPEITLESSWRLGDRDARLRAHVDLVMALVAELEASGDSVSTQS